MEAAKKLARVQLLEEIGREVAEELSEKHAEVGGDPREIVFHAAKLAALIDEYSEILEEYRRKHKDGDGLLDGDKIAAFTGVLIMRHWIFESETQEVNTAYSGMANETFAVRVAQLFLKKISFGFTKVEHEQLISCFGICHDHNDCLTTWTVATMTLHLKDGTFSETAYQD